jgi:ADP-dependent NAD(P)H-hydrate dehydratase
MSDSSNEDGLPLPLLPKRALDSHKGDFGTALLVGGSRGMTGAIALAGMAALRSGAGRVRLAIPDPCLETVAAFEPSYMTLPLPADEEGRFSVAARQGISEAVETATALGCGPGLGRSQQLSALVNWIYQVLPKPVVLDADALFALAANLQALAEPGGPRIMTPHPGEFRRFLPEGRWSRDDMEEVAKKKAAKWKTTIVLKGHRTLITDGRESFHNNTGNPGMATGGTGDVLTGVITALLGQGLSPLDAARLGVWIHGRAGDLAAEELGEVSLTATDLIRFLPFAFQQLAALRAED